MAGNLAIASSQPAHIKTVEQLRSKHITPAKTKIQALLKPVRAVSPEGMAITIAADRDKWIHTITALHQDAGSVFADYAATQLAKRSGFKGFDPKDKSYLAGVSAFISTYSANQVPGYVDQIIHSFKVNIERAQEGKAAPTTTKPKPVPANPVSSDQGSEGDDEEAEDFEDQIGSEGAPNFDGLIDGIFGAGALMIAGSTIVLASGLGALAGANAFSGTTGVQVVKVWQALEDSHTRSAHSDADGQERSPDEPFDVGGDQLLFPLDTSLGAGPDETMNCRCIVGFDVSSAMRSARRLDWAERMAATVRANLHLVERVS